MTDTRITSTAGDPTEAERLQWECCELKRELAEAQAWIAKAAPTLERAAVIVCEDSIDRLDEIEGVIGLLQTCPVHYQNRKELND